MADMQSLVRARRADWSGIEGRPRTAAVTRRAHLRWSCWSGRRRWRGGACIDSKAPAAGLAGSGAEARS